VCSFLLMFSDLSKDADNQMLQILRNILYFITISLNGVTRGVVTIEYVCIELLTTQIGLTVLSLCRSLDSIILNSSVRKLLGLDATNFKNCK
jgi:hypothetical protein